MRQTPVSPVYVQYVGAHCIRSRPDGMHTAISVPAAGCVVYAQSNVNVRLWHHAMAVLQLPIDRWILSSELLI